MDSLKLSWRITMVFGSLIVVAAQCPTGCSECNSSQKCIGCLERYRLDGTTCVACPAKCLNCSADNTCQRCESPYYGTTYPHCNNTCPVNCDIRGCDAVNGLCFGCRDKYYGPRCDKSCDLCKNGVCDRYSCRDGCFSGYYENKRSDLECLPCIDNCISCTDSENCITCADGYFTVNKYFCTACSSYIHNCVLCNYSGSVSCKACQGGYNLQNKTCVEFTCPTNCQGNCNSDGACIGGCMEGFSGTRCEYRCASKCLSCAQDDPSICTSCIGDFYTSSCTVPCSLNCIVINGLSTCNFTGHCTNSCLDGYWRSACNQMCPLNCKTCEQISGTCLECKNFFYGLLCEKWCNSNCLDTDQSATICKSGTGECLQGCKPGFTGSHCNISASSTVTDVSTTTLNSPEDSNLKIGSSDPCTSCLSSERTNDGLNAAMIGGAIAGSVVATGMLIGIGVFCFKRRSRWPHSPNSTYVNASVAVINSPRNRHMNNRGSGMEAEQSINPSLYETLSQTEAGSEYSVLPAQSAEVSDTPSREKSPTIYYNIS